MYYKFNTFIRYKGIIIIIFVFFTAIFSSCINLRVDYPEIKYYGLEPEEKLPSRLKVDGILQVRTFTGSNILSTRRFLVEKYTKEIEQYYYHRWNDDFTELFTWLCLSRLNTAKIFTGGVVPQNTVQIPNYILEGEILELKIYNGSEKLKDSSYAQITIKANILGFNPDSTNFISLYTNVYTSKVFRETDKAITIAPAVNKAANQIVTTISEDLVKVLTNQ